MLKTEFCLSFYVSIKWIFNYPPVNYRSTQRYTILQKPNRPVLCWSELAYLESTHSCIEICKYNAERPIWDSGSALIGLQS